jgi:hypothetical protein
MKARFAKMLGAFLALGALSIAPVHAQYDGDNNGGGNNGGDGNNSGEAARGAGSGPSAPSGPSMPAVGGPSGPCVCKPAPAATAAPGVATTRGAAPSGPSTASPSNARRPMAVASTSSAVKRGPTTRSLMKVLWEYPVQAAEHSDATQVEQRTSLSRADAIRALAGDDPRPLLVVRECVSCNKTDRTLLSPGVDNERTILLSRFFHCVKLPMNANEAGSPYQALFSSTSPEHMFVCQKDGSAPMSLATEDSRPELWATLERALSASYTKDAAAAVREMSKQIDLIDTYERQLQELERRRDGLVEGESRPDASKVRRLEEDAIRLRQSMQSSIASIDRLSHMGFKSSEKPARSARSE